MPKNLVIVESPAKAKTIENYLGSDFKVVSSYGHIADLPAKELGVEVEGDFSPNYIVNADKKKVVKELSTWAAQADWVWLASDEDREGEAIAWHLAENLQLKPEKTKRIVFHEITKTAIHRAIENPREIDYNLVNAQQARRVLDRLVGYELSPVLWRKVKGGLSAGRVQSVAVRLIVEREREIQDFSPTSSFKVNAIFNNDQKKSVPAQLELDFSDEKTAYDFLEKNKNANFSVDSLTKTPAKKTPAAPFTTSTLQQEASRKLGFSVSRTMQNAQRLYEAGHITYMRTDSVNLSKEALDAAAQEIGKAFGEKYAKRRVFSSKSKGAQEAHEAIRPTNFALQTLAIDRDQQRLYELIWKRAIASQMSDAELERTTIKIGANTYKERFVAKGEVITFDGFLTVYLEGQDDDEEEQSGLLPTLKKGETLFLQTLTATQRFSRPPYRYTEASLVKKLEELGIGRPSTYAPTITTIMNRKYVEKGTVEGQPRKFQQLQLKNTVVESKTLSEKVGSDKGKLVPTDVGMLVTDFLMNNFHDIMDYHFTAKVEEDFDDIADGKKDWTSMMREFYGQFHPQVEEVAENAEREIGERILGIDPKTGRQLSVRLGRFGPMAQIGTVEDEEKPLFASLMPDQQLNAITFEEALNLFKLPSTLGEFDGQEVVVNNGRFGPYVKFGKKFISIPAGKDPLSVSYDEAVALIKEKQQADAPIAHYENLEVTKGKGRFGPFIKWNGLFINVNKKYDFDNLSQHDIEILIEEKKQKEADKLIHDWPEAGIRVEKARWGRSVIIKGSKKVELNKTIDAQKLSLEEVQKMLAEPSKKKKTSKKK